ncbi:MAG: hypothetical protein V1901_03675 [Patescibacteria group bacterium]
MFIGIKMNIKNYIKDKALYIPVIILMIYFIIRLVNESVLVTNFPLDFSNDISSHIAKLYFLAKYGFHHVVPNWYNGFNYVLFESYPPGWYFSALPLYLLIGNVQLAAYISLILIYLGLFLTIFYLGKTQDISVINRVAFFLFLFANPITLGYLLRLGKLPELLGWLWVIILFIIIINYKDKNLNIKFLYAIPFLSFLLITNTTSFVVFSPIIISLLLIKNNKERLIILGVVVVSLILTAFWWIPFVNSYFNSNLGGLRLITWVLYFSKTHIVDNLSTIFTTGLFLGLYYLYWIDKRSKKDLLFFSPFVIMALLLLSRLIIFIPIFSSAHPDNYNIMFMFLSLYLLFKTQYSKNLVKIIIISIYVFVIVGVIISILYTPFYQKHTIIENDTIGLLPFVDGNFILISNNTYTRALYSYGAIYYNTSTLLGWDDVGMKPEVIKEIYQMHLGINCTNLRMGHLKYKLNYVIADYENCKKLKACDFAEIKVIGSACLFSL